MSDLLSKIKLLDDPDDQIFQVIKESLISEGPSAIPYLEELWTKETNPIVQERIEDIIHSIQYREVSQALYQWKLSAGVDLAYGAYLVTKYLYPELKWDDINQTIDKIKQSVWVELNQNLTALEKIRLLNHILFEINQFRADTYNPNAHHNFMIHHVLKNQKGNSLTLSIIYISIAQRLNLPVFGVDLPKNFICCYVDKLSAFEAFGDLTDNAVLFYINPHNRGSIFGRKEIDYFLSQTKIEPQDDFYNPADNIAVIRRLLSNLIVLYQAFQNNRKFDGLNELLTILLT